MKKYDLCRDELVLTKRAATKRKRAAWKRAKRKLGLLVVDIRGRIVVDASAT